MSIAELGTYCNSNFYYAAMQGSMNNCFNNTSFSAKYLSSENEIAQCSGIDNNEDSKIIEYDTDSDLSVRGIQRIPVTSKELGEPAAYSRLISANIKTKEMIAEANSRGEVIYSYRETEQQFNILINSDGEKKTYTIHGFDENGNEIEEEFDPYNLDPEAMNYPEFSALCLYIRQSDETADLIAGSFFTDTGCFDGIFDKGNRVELLDQYANEYRYTLPDMAELASKLFESINSFFENVMQSKCLDANAISKLFEDRDKEISIPDTIISKHDEVTDPDTNQVIPIDIKYITCYSEKGISCKEVSNVNGKTTTRDLWDIPFNSPDDYKKVQNFLNRFSKDKTLTFASNETFWKDFLEDVIDIDSFITYFDSLSNGHIDFENMPDGKTLRDALSDPYADYININHFIGHVWTEQEMWDDWNAKIEANQKALANENTLDSSDEANTHLTKLGFGFIAIGNLQYGMTASLVNSPDTDDIIVNVELSGGESINVNLSKFDPSNATPAEMFAYCEYMDSIGKGTNSTWGSWHMVKSIISPLSNMQFDSVENVMNQTMNWSEVLANSPTVLKKYSTGEITDASTFLKMFKESMTITAEDLSEEKDWREMSDAEWAKMLEGIDENIEAIKERIKQMLKQKEEAARKAASQSDSDMKANAISQAVLSVAANGFSSTDSSENEAESELPDGTKPEKNWTKKMQTDDQFILRTAKAAQEYESEALRKLEELANDSYSSTFSYHTKYYRKKNIAV